jgi:hypothetical protein
MQWEIVGQLREDRLFEVLEAIAEALGFIGPDRRQALLFGPPNRAYGANQVPQVGSVQDWSMPQMLGIRREVDLVWVAHVPVGNRPEYQAVGVRR